eukprot:scaffold28961_cov65-Phaeocystis_antarctica.AAC.3
MVNRLRSCFAPDALRSSGRRSALRSETVGTPRVRPSSSCVAVVPLSLSTQARTSASAEGSGFIGPIPLMLRTQEP